MRYSPRVNHKPVASRRHTVRNARFERGSGLRTECGRDGLPPVWDEATRDRLSRPDLERSSTIKLHTPECWEVTAGRPRSVNVPLPCLAPPGQSLATPPGHSHSDRKVDLSPLAVPREPFAGFVRRSVKRNGGGPMAANPSVAGPVSVPSPLVGQGTPPEENWPTPVQWGNAD